MRPVQQVRKEFKVTLDQQAQPVQQAILDQLVQQARKVRQARKEFKVFKAYKEFKV